MRQLPALAVFATLAAPAWAAGVTVTGAFARATPPGADSGVVYMTLQSDADDALTGISTGAAASASLHQTTMTGMVMAMDQVSQAALPAGRELVLSPDHMHIMLEGLKHPLLRGSSIPLHLSFAKAPAEDIMVPVGSLGATAPGE